MELRKLRCSESKCHEAGGRPGIGPLLNSILIMHFSLVFWILSVLTIIPYRFSQLREFWKSAVPPGTSVYDLCVVDVSLLAILLVVDAWASWRLTAKFGWFHATGYLACAAVILMIGRDLYAFVEIPLNDEWYYRQVKSEPLDISGYQLGRVVQRGVDGCEVPGSDCILVELLTGKTVTVTVRPEIAGAPSPIVVVEQRVGRFSGMKSSQVNYYYPVDDAEFFWRVEKHRYAN